jgi:GNAT superfamily N-acetyltransferase
VKYTVELLEKRHNRNDFNCGEESLNHFIKQFARQNNDKGLGRTFVAVLPKSPKIYGYYTLAGGTIRFDTVTDKLPRYPIPVVLLGRLAVDQETKGQGLGEFLLFDALRRASRIADELGIYAVEVYALNEQARNFYKKYEFIELSDDPFHLHLLMKTIRELSL